MPNAKLTKTRIDAIEFDPAGPIRQITWDTALPGFGVRVQPKGTKSYVLLYRVGERKRLVKLGAIGDFQTVDLARDAAREARRTVRLEDRDPIPSRPKKINLVADLVDDWLGYLKDKDRKEKYIKDTASRLRRHVLPDIGGMRPQDVNSTHIDRIHRRITKAGHKADANNVVRLVHALFNYAVRIKAFPSTEPNPAAGVEKNPSKDRKVFVRPEEMPALLASIEAEPDPYHQAFFMLALLTGARRGELLGLKWEDADLKNRTLTFRDTKNREDHVLAISQTAVEILEALPRQSGNPYVICGHKRGSALVNPDKPWKRIKARAGLGDVHIHDLRRTYGSWLASKGRTTQQIGKTLGHKSNITAKVYAEIAESAKSDLAEQMAALVQAARGAA